MLLSAKLQSTKVTAKGVSFHPGANTSQYPSFK